MTQYSEISDTYRPMVTVVIPTIRPRRHLLGRALDSVSRQTIMPHLAIEVVEDTEHAGAAVTRQRGLARVTTPWVAFLDDDDELMPNHLLDLFTHAIDHQADYAYSWFMIKDREGNEHPEWDPFPDSFGRPWDPDSPVQTTITTLVRTELAQAVGFDTVPDGEMLPDGHRRGEDYRFTMGCQAAGGVISHLPARTWWWYHHGENTSGMPDRWH